MFISKDIPLWLCASFGVVSSPGLHTTFQIKTQVCANFVMLLCHPAYFLLLLQNWNGRYCPKKWPISITAFSTKFKAKAVDAKPACLEEKLNKTRAHYLCYICGIFISAMQLFLVPQMNIMWENSTCCDGLFGYHGFLSECL